MSKPHIVSENPAPKALRWSSDYEWPATSRCNKTLSLPHLSFRHASEANEEEPAFLPVIIWKLSQMGRLGALVLQTRSWAPILGACSQNFGIDSDLESVEEGDGAMISRQAKNPRKDLPHEKARQSGGDDVHHL